VRSILTSSEALLVIGFSTNADSWPAITPLETNIVAAMASPDAVFIPTSFFHMKTGPRRRACLSYVQGGSPCRLAQVGTGRRCSRKER
jgi:hypothetical protein